MSKTLTRRSEIIDMSHGGHIDLGKLECGTSEFIIRHAERDYHLAIKKDCLHARVERWNVGQGSRYDKSADRACCTMKNDAVLSLVAILNLEEIAKAFNIVRQYQNQTHIVLDDWKRE